MLDAARTDITHCYFQENKYDDGCIGGGGYTPPVNPTPDPVTPPDSGKYTNSVKTWKSIDEWQAALQEKKDDLFNKLSEYDKNIPGKDGNVESLSAYSLTALENGTWDKFLSLGRIEVPDNNQGETSTEYTYDTSNQDVKTAFDTYAKSIEDIMAALGNGNLVLYKQSSGEKVDISDVMDALNSWKDASTTTTSSSTTSEITYFSKDDAKIAKDALEKDYEEKKLALEKDDKMIQMQLSRANTEYSAACTEAESLKSLISENTERSFSLFG